MRTAGFLYISEAMGTIVAAIIGAIAGIIGTFLTFVLPERKKRPGLIANLLDGIAKNVTQMIAMFEKEEIPHQAGHELYSTIDYFEEGTHRALLSQMALETLSELKKLSKEAEAVDVVLYSGKNGEKLRTAWVTKAKGIVGELRGEAAKLRARF